MENKAKDIVPPLDLCKLIPIDEFTDSVLVWERNIGLDRTEYEPVVNTRKAALDYNIICPAPTLEEVLKKLPLATCRQYFEDGDWCVELNHVVVCEPCAASAALQLWLARQKPKP